VETFRKIYMILRCAVKSAALSLPRKFRPRSGGRIKQLKLEYCCRNLESKSRTIFLYFLLILHRLSRSLSLPSPSLLGSVLSLSLGSSLTLVSDVLGSLSRSLSLSLSGSLPPLSLSLSLYLSS